MTSHPSAPIVDWSNHPTVVLARRREKISTALYAFLAFSAGTILSVISLSDGLTPIDALYLAVVALVSFFGVAALSSLVAFEQRNGGLKVYPDGLALPWRTREAAKRGEENFLAFRLIAEVRLVTKKGKSGIVVVRRDEEKTREFLVEPGWIPDMGALLDSLRGQVAVKESC